MTAASIIIPTFKRIEQTLNTIQIILDSTGLESTKLEVIVADSTPDDSLKRAIADKFGTSVIYTKPKTPGIATNKNQGARVAKHPILIFCDSDIRLEKDTIANTIKALQQHKSAGMVSGDVFWYGGKLEGSLDRPRKEDRRITIGKTTYIESIYSRYIATYKDVFWKVGGYDEVVFNFRGEGSDLSIRYWQAGFPLVYESLIKSHHIHDVSHSAALRVPHPEWGIAKDLLLLGYKYNLFDKDEGNFIDTVSANFKQFDAKGYYRILQGIGNNLDFIVQVKSIIDRQKKSMNPVYPFAFLEVFSDKKLFLRCIKEAEKRLTRLISNKLGSDLEKQKV